MSPSVLEYIVILSTILELNPLLQVVKSVRTKSVQDVSLSTFALIMGIGGMWLLYGISIGNLPLIIGNAFKLASALSVLVTYVVYRKKKPAPAN